MRTRLPATIAVIALIALLAGTAQAQTGGVQPVRPNPALSLPDSAPAPAYRFTIMSGQADKGAMVGLLAGVVGGFVTAGEYDSKTPRVLIGAGGGILLGGMIGSMVRRPEPMAFTGPIRARFHDPLYSSAPIEGTLLAITDDSAVFTVDGGQTRRFARGTVRSIEVVTGQGPNFRQGTLIGGMIGGALGLMAGGACGDGWGCPGPAWGALGGLIVGAPIGAIIGSLSSSDRWARIAGN